MKKSEMYRMAQMAVVSSGAMSPNVKVAIVKELIERENFEKYCEKIEDEKNAKD